MNLFSLFLLISFAYIAQIFCQSGSPVTVSTTRGTLVGYHLDQGNDTTQTLYGSGDIFLGIPFALAPQPRPLVTFPGPSPYNATYYRKVCIQPIQDNLNMSKMSEDCLFVNILTPNAASTTKYPVYFYIHGGSLITGSSHMGNQEIIRNFVSKGIVFSSIDYRMSWLGFFTTFTDDFPPNLGMLDQTMALKFIKEEIGYFGGDSNKITIAGHSAGSHSVSSHTYSPLTQNLFQQVIMQSGTVLTCYEDSLGHSNRNLNFARIACNFTQDMWNAGNFTALKDCLMNISVDDGEAFAMKTSANVAICWNMVQDNYFFPGTPQTLGPKRPNIPAMVGNCRDEAAGGEIDRAKTNPNLTEFTRQQVYEDLLHSYEAWFGNGTKAQEVIKIWIDNYLPPGTADDDHFAWMNIYISVGTAAFFTWGSLKEIEYYLQNNNPNVYAYEFDWSSPLNDNGNVLPYWHPVPHSCEMAYVYGYGSGGKWTATEQAIANLIQDTFANFALIGKPTKDGTWKPATSKNYTELEYFSFFNVSTPKVGFRAADQIAWNQVIPPVVGDYPQNVPDNQPLCTRGYTSKIKNTTCYEAFGTPLSWTDAQTACAQNSYGALASVGSAFENSDLLAYAKNTFPSCTGFYIGLFKSGYTPNWIWVNYDPSAYRNWKSGSPGQNPSCVVLNTNDGTWTSQSCNTSLCYVCSY